MIDRSVPHTRTSNDKASISCVGETAVCGICQSGPVTVSAAFLQDDYVFTSFISMSVCLSVSQNQSISQNILDG